MGESETIEEACRQRRLTWCKAAFVLFTVPVGLWGVAVEIIPAAYGAGYSPGWRYHPGVENPAPLPQLALAHVWLVLLVNLALVVCAPFCLCARGSCRRFMKTSGITVLTLAIAKAALLFWGLAVIPFGWTFEQNADLFWSSFGGQIPSALYAAGLLLCLRLARGAAWK